MFSSNNCWRYRFCFVSTSVSFNILQAIFRLFISSTMSEEFCKNPSTMLIISMSATNRFISSNSCGLGPSLFAFLWARTQHIRWYWTLFAVATSAFGIGLSLRNSDLSSSFLATVNILGLVSSSEHSFFCATWLFATFGRLPRANIFS